jgi:hypothetical protein
VGGKKLINKKKAETALTKGSELLGAWGFIRICALL